MENSLNSFALRVAAARFDYEYLNLSAEQISEKHCLPLASVKQEISEAGWQARNPSDALVPSDGGFSPQATGNGSGMSANLLTDTAERINILDAYRIQEHLPYAIAIQRLVLAKSYSILAAMDIDNPGPNELKLLQGVHAIVESVLAKIPSAFTPSEDGAPSDKKPPVQVLIQNNIQ